MSRLLVLCIFLLIVSCGPTVDIARLNSPSTTSLKILLTTGIPNQPYVELGMIRVRQRWRWQSADDLLNEIRKQAEELGADAVIRLTYGENHRGYVVLPSSGVIKSIMKDEIAGIAVRFLRDKMSTTPSFETNQIISDLPDTLALKAPSKIISPVNSTEQGFDVYIINSIVGDTIDKREAIQYGLFKDITGFSWARYFTRQSDRTYWIEFWFTDEQGVSQRKFNKVPKIGVDYVKSKIK